MATEDDPMVLNDLEDYGHAPCWACNGSGSYLVCPDDICHGIGECIHGDGEIDCPECNGTGDGL